MCSPSAADVRRKVRPPSPLMLKRGPLILPLSGGDSEGVVDGFSGTPCVLASLARVPLASRRGEGLSAG